MSTVIVRPGAVITKDSAEARVITFDWDTENLATAITISVSVWEIAVVRPPDEVPIALDNDNESVVAPGNRTTQTRLTGGTLGSVYYVTNRITTSESPTQTKEASCYVRIANK